MQRAPDSDGVLRAYGSWLPFGTGEPTRRLVRRASAGVTPDDSSVFLSAREVEDDRHRHEADHDQLENGRGDARSGIAIPAAARCAARETSMSRQRRLDVESLDELAHGRFRVEPDLGRIGADEGAGEDPAGQPRGSLRSSASSAAIENFVCAAMSRSDTPRRSRASRSFAPKSDMAARQPLAGPARAETAPAAARRVPAAPGRNARRWHRSVHRRTGQSLPPRRRRWRRCPTPYRPLPRQSPAPGRRRREPLRSGPPGRAEAIPRACSTVG